MKWTVKATNVREKREVTLEVTGKPYPSSDEVRVDFEATHGAAFKFISAEPADEDARNAVQDAEEGIKSLPAGIPASTVTGR